MAGAEAEEVDKVEEAEGWELAPPGTTYSGMGLPSRWVVLSPPTSARV